MTPRPAPLLRLAPVLRRQFGVVTARQAREREVRSATLADLAERGLLRRRHRGVYQCALVPDSWEARAMAALLATGHATVLARFAAARVLGLVRPGQRTDLDLLVPRDASFPRSVQPRPRTSVGLRPSDAVLVGRLRCTGVAWTVADLAAVTTARSLERIAGRAVAERLTSHEELSEVADRFRGCAGAARLRRVIGDTRDATPGTRSRAESRFVALVVRAGLPRPAVNLPVEDASGRRRELDAAWPDWGVAAEIDLHPSHATTLGRRADGARQNDLVHRWTVLRFDRHDLEQRPAEVVRQTRAALAGAGWPGPGGVPRDLPGDDDRDREAP